MEGREIMSLSKAETDVGVGKEATMGRLEH
jgi:hypothetical protein